LRIADFGLRTDKNLEFENLAGGVMNKHILIVEDSLTQAAELKDLLQEHGYQITVAANGQEGLAAARKRKPDLIISDIIMPVMDGYEMCQAIKHDEALKDIPVILLTVLSDTEDVVRALKAGVDYYLTKPYHENHLLSQVESALAKPVQQKSKGPEEELEVTFSGERHVITSDRQQMLNLLLSTYDNAVRQNRDLIKTQRELQKLNEQLEEKIRELEEVQDRLIRAERLATIGQLGASVGHELRHPLSVISNSVYYLSMRLKDADEKLNKHLMIMEREIAVTDKIISDLLSFARGERPALRKTQVNTIVQDALSRTPVPDEVTVVTELGRGLPPLMADPGQIEQVFINMISNAIQAMTSPGSPSTSLERRVEMSNGGRLEIATMAEEGFIVTEFKDSGCGISRENMKRLFGPLFTTKTKGIGLGLAVSKRIVEAHGGSIEVGSKVGKGATFRVKLPILVS
jgi:signal transduction histidine kinase